MRRLIAILTILAYVFVVAYFVFTNQLEPNFGPLVLVGLNVAIIVAVITNKKKRVKE